MNCGVLSEFRSGKKWAMSSSTCWGRNSNADLCRIPCKLSISILATQSADFSSCDRVDRSSNFLGTDTSAGRGTNFVRSKHRLKLIEDPMTTPVQRAKANLLNFCLCSHTVLSLNLTRLLGPCCLSGGILCSG
jgi:hypothetical protein